MAIGTDGRDWSRQQHANIDWPGENFVGEGGDEAENEPKERRTSAIERLESRRRPVADAFDEKSGSSSLFSSSFSFFFNPKKRQKKQAPTLPAVTEEEKAR